MRLLYFGSGAFGLPTLERLADTHDLIAVVTQPDRPAGRKRRLTPTPVAQWAEPRGVETWKCDDVNDADFVEKVRAASPDASVVIAFGQKLSPTLIEAMGELAVNLHGSLLPKYRGAAPIQWAMIEGESETGVSVISLAQRMDAGEVYATASTPIDPQETAGELHDRLAALGPEAVERVLSDLEAGTLSPQPQDDSQASRAPKLTKADGTVDFGLDAEAVRRRVHALTPWPACRVALRPAGSDAPLSEPLTLCRVRVVAGASESVEPGTVMDELRVATGTPGRAIELGTVQPPGGKAMPVTDYARGHAEFGPGAKLLPWNPA
ncbi:MAG: methionyl-tRNA formyltransferase [Phycisphaeraceae bacterium]